MSRNLILSLAGLFIFFLTSCSSDDTISSDLEKENETDSVEVGFSFGGDFEITEKPITKASDKPVVYHIRIKDLDGSQYYKVFGYVGVFTDLKNARIRLKRNKEYLIEASAIREVNRNIDVDLLSTVFIKRLESQHTGQYVDVGEFSVLNKFSSYLYEEEEMTGWELCEHYYGAVSIPYFNDEPVERFYNDVTLKVKSNEKINIDLNRYSYILTCEMDPPSGGHIELSCDAPSFRYSVDSNEEHRSISSMYSLGGTSLEEACKTITLKLEHFDSDGVSTDVTTREISVKPNVETIVKVNFDKFNADNTFGFTLNESPMGKEEYEWK